ncbi:phage major capsid protein [Patescibacteria group bacterium]|nr:phage major capsid protein [Patescibacteria group bacterium]
MPISGMGAVPAAGSVYNELTSTVRRAFVPALTVQIYFSTPTLFYLLGAAQKSAGGLSQITVPVQGNSMVQGQFTGYGGGFNKPIVTPGIQNAQFNTAFWVVPVPLPFGETIIQSTDTVIPLLKARMNDVYATTVQNMGGLIFTNNTANSLYPSSFIDGFDNGTNAPVYGGINRTQSGNTFWQGQYYDAAAANILTRQTISNYIIRITDNAGGEAPSFGVMSPGDYATLSGTLQGIEQQFVQPNKSYGMEEVFRSGFPNLNIDGIPIYMDHWCPKGNMFFVNSKYTSMYLNEDAMFDFSGFYSLVPLMQIGQVGVMVCGYQIITTKPVANAWITDFTGAAF